MYTNLVSQKLCTKIYLLTAGTKMQTQPNPTKPNQTQPNPTKPNQIQPNPTKPNQTQPNPDQNLF